jgi:gliding motility-associated-like protein
LPVVTLAALAPACLNTPPYLLTGGNPAGGSYSGPGVSGDTLYPSMAGVGTHNIKYTYTDPATSCTNSAIQPVLVNDLPVVSQQPFPNVCISTPSFQLTGGNPGGGTYSGPGVVNNIFYPDSAGPGTHMITYTYTDPITNCSNSIDSAINVALTIAISVTPDNIFICEGGSTTLTASGASTFSWSPSTGLTSTIGSAVVSSPPMTITYTITGSDANGCSGRTNATVNIYTPVQVNFLALPPDGCKPLNVQFLFTPSPQVQDSSWVWDFGDVISPDNSSTLEDPGHTYVDEGNYIVTLTLTSINGCTHTGTLPVNVYAKPTADFYWLPEVSNMENPLVDFIDASTGANYWYWNFGDPSTGINNESGIAYPSHFYSDSGTFEVLLIVEANHGCSDTITKLITIYPEIIIYMPNAFTPDNNQLNDVWLPSIVGIPAEGFEISIFDRWGKIVYTTNEITKGWDGRINGTVAPIGVYVWVMHYLDPTGKEYKRRGNVTLLR